MKEERMMVKRKKEMKEFYRNFKGMPDRLLKYLEILLEEKDASPYSYQDIMSFRRLAIEVTTKCNLNCLWCYRRDPNYKFILNKNISVEKLKEFVKNTKGEFRIVHLGGLGEPTLHPHFLDIIELSKNLSEKIKVTTNGTLLTKRLINEMIKRELTHIEISIDAFTEEKNREFRGSDLKDLIEIAKYISNETNLELQINSVVCSLNYEHLFPMVEVLENAKKLTVHTIPLFETKQMRDIGVRRISDERYTSLLRKIKADIEKYNLDWKMSPPPEGAAMDPIIEMKRKKNICFTCFEDPYLSVNCELLPCGRQKVYGGADATVGFEKAWNHPKLVEFRKNMLEGKYPLLCSQLCYLKERQGVVE